MKALHTLPSSRVVVASQSASTKPIYFLFSLLFVCIAWLAVAPVTLADQNAQQLLQSLSDASKNQRYHGIFTYQRGNEKTSMEIYRAVFDGVEHERVIHLEGEPREVVRSGKDWVCLDGDQKPVFDNSVSLNANINKLSNFDYARLSKQYDISVRSGNRVAGQPTSIIELTPKDTDRFGQRLFVGNTNSLLMKSEILGKGKALERFQFVRLMSADNLSKNDFISAAASSALQKNKAHRAKTKQHAQTNQCMVGWVPAGFTQDDDMSKARGGSVYHDGLSGFSVFCEPQQEKLPEGGMQQGATVVYSKPLVQSQQNVVVTVVGEIPKPTAKKIARSVALK